MATAAKVQRKAVKQVPAKKFNMGNGEPVEIPLTRQAKKAARPTPYSTPLKKMVRELQENSIDNRTLREILNDGRH
jgi:hypothetical protein